MYETSRQSRFDAQCWMLVAGALGWPRGMVWGGRREGGSGGGTRVFLWWIHFDVWQNQYSIVMFKNKIKLKKKKEFDCHCRRSRFDLRVKKIPWRRKWQTTSVFLSGKYHGDRSLVGYNSWRHKELDTIKWLNTHTWDYKDVILTQTRNEGAQWKLGLPGLLSGKECTCNAGDMGSIPESKRSPGEGNGNPLNGHEFEQTPGASEGQGSLVCCSPWGRNKLDMTWWLNNNNNEDLQKEMWSKK